MFRYISIVIMCLTISQLGAQQLSNHDAPIFRKNNTAFLIKDLSSFTNLTNYLPDNYVSDASVDYTPYLQKGIDENKKVLLPNFAVLINDKGLVLRDNSEVYFQDNSSLVLKASNKRKYQILQIHDKQNITLYAPKIRGDRYQHIGTSGGEWGMGISILGSKDINIFDPNISVCWGDGIYVGHSKTHSQNITIRGGVLDNNRRNGISIISGSKIIIEDILISNTKGTNPQTGIDIEPNNSNNEINEITIQNLTTYNNFHNGILIHLNKLPGKKRKEVNIKIKGFKDVSSGRAIRISGAYNGDKKNKKLKGQIVLESINTENSKNPSIFNKNIFFPSIKIKK